MDTLLLSLFIAFISLVIIDAFLTYVGVRRGHQERMPCTKKLIEKLGLGKAMIVKSVILVGFGIFFFTMGLIIPEIRLSVIIIFVIIVIFFSYVVIQNVVQLLKSQSKREVAS